ncbi:MAG: radical SAM protein [Candidatus Sericytochromatia bacterium]|nr:radical SAM protein [Candidatus Sericytochromatia bacterium]
MPDTPSLADIPTVVEAYAAHTPLFASLELTLRCNLRCTHCYNFDRSGPAPTADGLSPEAWRAVIDALVAEGCLEICFTGGEALLHPHLDALIRHARGHLCAVRVKSNGIALDAARAQRLYEAGVYAIDLSVYGASAATHDALTGVPGSHRRTLEGARAARDAGLRVTLSFCITRENAPEVAAMIALAGAEGVGHTLDPQISARYDGTRSSLGHRVDPATLEALYRGPLAEALGTPTCRRDADMQCSCARGVVAVAANGDVYPCIAAPVVAGNVLEGGLSHVWRTSPVLNRIRRLGLADYPTCAACPDRGYCRRSNGVSYVNTGEYTGVDPWSCEEAAIIRRIAEGEPPAPRP